MTKRFAKAIASRSADPGRYFHCDQYANDNNWLSHYHTTAAEILVQTEGQLTHFVGGIGTGGTITGIGRRLKKDVPAIEIVQIVPEDFPGVEGLKPLENPGDIIPKILDSSVVDHKFAFQAWMRPACVRCSQVRYFRGPVLRRLLAGCL